LALTGALVVPAATVVAAAAPAAGLASSAATITAPPRKAARAREMMDFFIENLHIFRKVVAIRIAVQAYILQGECQQFKALYH
jgi:uncharacterized membrane protein (DUF4010 family)